MSKHHVATAATIKINTLSQQQPEVDQFDLDPNAVQDFALAIAMYHNAWSKQAEKKIISIYSISGIFALIARLALKLG